MAEMKVHNTGALCPKCDKPQPILIIELPHPDFLKRLFGIPKIIMKCAICEWQRDFRQWVRSTPQEALK